MKTVKTAFTMATASALAAAALAGQGGEAGNRKDGSRSIELTAPIVVLGATVPSGLHTLRWNTVPGTESVQIEIKHGRKLLASGKGAWVTVESPSPYESLVYSSDNGAKSLAEIRFANSKDIIRLEAAAPPADAPADN
jgi:hypothetical protein